MATPVTLADPALRATLTAVAAALAGAADPWWIIAGAACALHGLAEPARDVDVLLGAADARRLLPPLGLTPQPRAPHPRFRSALFATWRAPPLPVEFMAGFEARAGDGWTPVSPTTRDAFLIDAATLYAPARAELRALLTLFGRPQDLARAARLG